MNAKKLFFISVVLFLSVSVSANLRLPSVISDNMVLQQESEVAVWGWSSPGSKVTIKPSWSETLTDTKADENGKWTTTIETPEATKLQQSLVISDGREAITVQNVLIGEVWICSGQSNMDWSIMQFPGAEEAIASADLPNIRLFKVARNASEEPVDDCEGQWKISSGDNIRDFSAVAYYFGRELYDKLDIPIGLIHTAWSGSPAEAWTPTDVIKTNSSLAPIMDRSDNREHWAPGSLYNGMIHPFLLYRIKGSIWYQGESNLGRAEEYAELFPAMIESWRQAWQQGDFPFYFVQLAPYNYESPDGVGCPEIQEAQLYTMKTVSNTGMVVTTDIGDINDIHPANKVDVGKRLSLWALARNYGHNVPYSGPVYRDMVVEGAKSRLFFYYDEGGLISKDGKLREFTIAGDDMVFYPATATTEGRSVVVSSDEVAEPVAVRYCWRNIAEGNFFNGAALPASPFRTDSSD